VILSTQHLSPGHLLIGEPLTQVPSAAYTNVKCNRLSRWQAYQQQLQQFWQQWSSDYLHNLQQRQRWQRTFPNLQPGDLILLKEDNTTPLHWPTVVITETQPGKDGIVRVVTLPTPTGILKRPITKICPLPRVNNELYLFLGVAEYTRTDKFYVLMCILSMLLALIAVIKLLNLTAQYHAASCSMHLL
jgi:hypothetical protein